MAGQGELSRPSFWRVVGVWGIAVGVGCLVCVAQLRAVLPPWAVGVSVTWAVTCGLVAWLSARADQARREAAERADREFRVAEMRPDQPLAMFHLVVKAIHETTHARVLHVHPQR